MKPIILFTALFFLVSCGKDGAQGPAGEQGTPGLNGTPGKDGIPGKDGSTILSGTSNPNMSLGKNGDFYLNLTTGDLFGPKMDIGWGNAFNMKGSKGDKGEAGSTILTGKGAPLASVGKVGDYYIDITNIFLYGPKTATSWGSAVSLNKNEKNGISVYSITADFSTSYSLAKDSSFTGVSKPYLIPNAKDKTIELFWYSSIPHFYEPVISQPWFPLFADTKGRYVNFGPLDLNLLNVVFDANVITSNNDLSVTFGIKGKGFEIGTPDFSQPSQMLRFLVKITDVDYRVLSKDISDSNRFRRINKDLNVTLK